MTNIKLPRTIQFRAWDEENKKMLYNFPHPPYHVFCDEEGCFGIGHQGEEDDWTEPIVMQFTGLLDKNYKHIFEGDIVEVDLLFTKEKAVIQMIDGCWEVKFEKPYVMPGDSIAKDRDYLKCHTCNYMVKVIGNIYENTELLHVRKICKSEAIIKMLEERR